MAQPNEEVEQMEVCCFGLGQCRALQLTLDEMEWLSHDNDNYVIFRVDGISSSLLTYLNGTFYSSRNSLGKDHILVKKVSSNAKCSIVLIYKMNDKKLVLIEGTVITSHTKFKVKQFIIGMNLELIENSQEYVNICDLEIQE